MNNNFTIFGVSSLKDTNLQAKDQSFFNLSKADITLLKAVGIILIICHNYAHKATAVSENQVDFKLERVMGYMDSIINDPFMFIETTLAFLGHYGVQLFIFASAYGLSKKRLVVEEGYFKYLFGRLVKIYSLLAAAFIFFYVYTSICRGGWMDVGEFLVIVKHYVLMKANFYRPLVFQYVGPWWFFGLIIQFYIFFPLLFKAVSRLKVKGTAFLLVACYFLIYFLHSLENLGFSEFPTFGSLVGHLPEFILGVLFAVFPNLKINGKIALAALVILALSCFYGAVFPLSFLSSLVLLLYLSAPLMRVSKDKLIIKCLLFIGQISMFLFVTNGPLRDSTLVYAKGVIGTKVGMLIHFLLVLLVSYLMYVIYGYVGKLIKKKTGISIL